MSGYPDPMHAGGVTISEMGLKAVARPAEGRTLRDLVGIVEDLGNEIVGDEAGGLILVEKTFPISYDPTQDFEPFEMLWKCDHCEAYSRHHDTVAAHEREVHGA